MHLDLPENGGSGINQNRQKGSCRPAPERGDDICEANKRVTSECRYYRIIDVQVLRIGAKVLVLDQVADSHCKQPKVKEPRCNAAAFLCAIRKQNASKCESNKRQTKKITSDNSSNVRQ